MKSVLFIVKVIFYLPDMLIFSLFMNIHLYHIYVKQVPDYDKISLKERLTKTFSLMSKDRDAITEYTIEMQRQNKVLHNLFCICVWALLTKTIFF